MSDLREKRSHKLSIYLLKPDLTSFRQALKSRVAVVEYKLKGTLKLDGIIYVGKTKYNEFPWQGLLQQGTHKSIPRLTNSSNRAVLLLKLRNRIYALPFGFGKHLMNEEYIDREFGMRTALNLVDPDKLRSLDKANLDDLTVLTKTQTSRRAKTQEFNIDTIRDMMRGVTGEPAPGYESLGSVITGSEGIYIVPTIDFEDIPGRLDILRRGFSSKAYLDRFGWIDNLKSERDPKLILKLQDMLVSELQSENQTTIHMAVPVMVDWENFEGFSFTMKGDLETEMSVKAFYEAKEEELSDLDWETLKKHKLYVKYANVEERTPIPLLRSLNFQTAIGKYLYVFAFSQWYKVDKSYAVKIRRFVEGIKESKLSFVDCDHGFNEDAYNKKLALSRGSFLLLDKKLIKSDVMRSRVEVCDVFATREKEFIHVKFKGSSGTLSHLFAQGRISANLLAEDIEFRKNLKGKLEDLGRSSAIIPLEQEEMDASKFTVTFAIIEDSAKTFVETLPFFSMLNLRLTANELRLRGFDVRVKKIQYSK